MFLSYLVCLKSHFYYFFIFIVLLFSLYRLIYLTTFLFILNVILFSYLFESHFLSFILNLFFYLFKSHFI